MRDCSVLEILLQLGYLSVFSVFNLFTIFRNYSDDRGATATSNGPGLGPRLRGPST